MKTSSLFLAAATIFLLLHTAEQTFAQANTSLSNLVSPTAVNQSLLPGTDNKSSLGTSAKSWKDLYLDGYLYIDGGRAITNVGTLNWFFGYNAGNTSLTGTDNTGIGSEAGSALTSGSRNVFMGNFTGLHTTTGYDNVYIGDAAGYISTYEYESTLIGSYAGFNNTTPQTTAVGYQALYSNANANYNSAFGYKTMYSNQYGTDNTATGYRALYLNVDGSNNTATGKDALFHNISGLDNTAVGQESLLLNEGDFNTGVGAYTLLVNVNGTGNTVMGTFAGQNTTASYNTFLGSSAGILNHGGANNTAIGASALQNNDDANDNTAVGYHAGENTTASSNAFFGYYSGNANTTGTYNSFFGNNSGIANTTGSYNMFFGRYSGYLNTDGNNNVAIGYSANSLAASNDNCTFLGNDADNTTLTDRSNSMALGNTARITASNQVRIGNAAVTSIGGYAGWTNLSDGRFKKNVSEDVPGLEFITQLKPVTYTLDITGIRQANGEDTEERSKGTADDHPADLASIADKENIVYTGFIAQEVEKAAKALQFDFSGVDAPKNESDFYGLRYAEFVVPLVKAVQEQQLLIEQQHADINDQNIRIEMLTARIEKLENLLTQATGSSYEQNILTSMDLTTAKLDQNIPNPFSQTTTISYYVPENVTGAQINFYGEHGHLIKSVSIHENGYGSLTIKASDLAYGVYQYSLLINGRTAATKKLEIIK
ncbi:MAG: tail fiber domain-containing protein [Chitinophagaceae bacterium]|nr:tail fiber domain-containing protein [Chitinophagaceae bacterium]